MASTRTNSHAQSDTEKRREKAVYREDPLVAEDGETKHADNGPHEVRKFHISPEHAGVVVSKVLPGEIDGSAGV